ncbi:ABC transporter substrate-binding protein [Desulfosarcina ovata]|uniref:Histidine ABC transporter substrate-binding protein n=1 Tax=Desulfosarcina ovata subsp. ovata TaxID=2752305 RepID=A0A5K8ABP4_9BACT|nr:ABC transporter substrate-binding protein [Desulfosarcina ovata]BBO89926.1 histidine ABC transporter substrate-binding protein [Desulfosarcina ovata subsp. ovata]
MKFVEKKWLVVTVVILVCYLISIDAWAADAKKTIVFNDRSWDSIQVHNRIAGFILEHGYGYRVDYMFADSMASLTGLGKGDIDVLMEMWVQTNIAGYKKLTESGKMVDLGPNFTNAPSGWYIPTYMVKGDPKRGIKPVAPDLKTVEDLPRYWELFKDPESPNKGRFYNNPSSWALTYEINETKIHTYGLDQYYNVFDSGSEMALVTSMVSAYENGKPWLGYFWEPTWVMGTLDMTMIGEPAYDPKRWVKKDYGCAWAADNVVICVNSKLVETNPDVVSFLKRYETSVPLTSSILAYMKDSGGKPEDAAIWFLREYPDAWHKWVPDNTIKRIEDAL